MKALALPVVVAATVLTGTAAAPAQAATCGTLPASVQGSPNLRAGDRGAAYLWHDAHGWQLGVTHHGTSRMVVTGTITASGAISHLTTVRLERGDAVAVSRDGHTLTFRMANVGHLDGVRFTAECSTRMRVALRVDGHVATPAQVHLGQHRVSPTSVPFTVQRS